MAETIHPKWNIYTYLLLGCGIIPLRFLSSKMRGSSHLNFLFIPK
ncbi:hypothetical protein TCEL_00747 [Thermobrachium celere DSM 8682]|uniref:Uncharacterized protein n=1 Tax=Thermobrachium celere DSM 8682 TaxID=941824 RepID=R7RTG5_9CLOT|nr:hypothetical protein TCEL_00747 [Thermobrachium celere DSM 8682]